MTDPERLQVYRQALATLVAQAGGELVVELDERPGAVMYRIELDQKAKTLKARLRFVPEGGVR